MHTRLRLESPKLKFDLSFTRLEPANLYSIPKFISLLPISQKTISIWDLILLRFKLNFLYLFFLVEAI
jgi:hypothetical protein